jgi:hypothetical protein
MKEEITRWINSYRNFQTGLSLLAKYKRNQNFVRILSKNPKKNAGKLLWELCKLAGYSIAQYNEFLNKKPAPKLTVIKPAKEPKSKPAPVDKKNIELPDSVKRIMHESDELYKERADLHRQMTEVPDDNADENVEKRKDLLVRIKELSAKLDKLYFAKDDYFKKGILPDIKKLFPEDPDTKKLKQLDNMELFKRKKNLESSIAKDRNLVKYQSKTTLENENPMPDGPKRKVIEERIQAKEKEIKEINDLLNVKAGN